MSSSGPGIGDIAIKLGVDPTGVATGMKYATAEILRSAREIDKAEQVEREYNLRQQTEAIEEANKAKIKAEEAFQKWYAKSLEEEFQLWYDSELRKEKNAQEFAAAQRATIDALAVTRMADADRRTKERADTAAMIAKYADQEAAAERAAMNTLAIARTEDADRRVKERTETAAMIAKFAAQEAADERAAMDAVASSRMADADRRTKERAETADMISRTAAQEAAAERAQADAVAAERMSEADSRIAYRRETAAMIARLAAQEAEAEQVALRETQRVAEQVRSDIRQTAINQYNAGARTAGPMPAEGMARALENDALEAAIRERYRLLDEAGQREARLTRARLLDQKRMEDDARRQELNDMRAAQAAREAAAAEEARSYRQARAARLDAKRAADDAERQSQNDIRAAQAAQRRSQEDRQLADAKTLIDRGTSAYDRHVATLVRLNQHRNAGRITLQQYNNTLRVLNAELLRNEAAERQAAQAARQHANAARVMTGVMTQASFALEDFTQGIIFGDLRTALLGASNNLTMVARGLIQMGNNAGGVGAALAGVWGWLIAIPAAAVGMLAAFNWAHYAEMDVRSLSDALNAANIGLEKFKQSANRLRRELETAFEIRNMTDVDAINNKIERIMIDMAVKERELQNLRRDAAIESNAFLENQLGGSEALLELQRQIDKTKAIGSAEEIAAAKELEVLMARIREAARQGNPETAIASLREMYTILNNMELDDAFDWVGDLTALDKLELTFGPGYIFSGEDQERLTEIRKTLLDTNAELTEAQRDQLKLEADLLDLAKQRSDVMTNLAQQGAEKVKKDQEELLLKLRMTDAERELYDLRKAQEDFMGPAAHGVMGMGGGPMDMFMQQALEQQNEADRLAFLEAQRDALRKDLDALVPEIIVKAGLEQNAMDAQAKAFEQMQQASAKKPNPQIERTNKLLESIDTAIKNGGRIEVIQ
jgi:hypothetical protein